MKRTAKGKSVIKAGDTFSLWPFAIVSVFLILAVANAFILYVAIRNRPARIVGNPYSEAKEYQTAIKMIKAAKAAHMDITVTHLGSSDDYLVEVTADKPLSSVSLTFMRMDTDRYDMKMKVLKGEKGRFVKIVKFHKRGLWKGIAEGFIEKERGRVEKWFNITM
ncbi:MAG: hypothetical protein D6808_06120 [Candidatus Dadabacteria bacterium]|nr:MAG: hypothetical protein D6808_06120 [Candidatus Dadabacteria bacterium]